LLDGSTGYDLAVEDVLASRSARAARNEHARTSVLAGIGSVIAIPAGLALAAFTRVTLHEAYAAIPIAVVLGLIAVRLARTARRHAWFSLGRIGGTRLARTGLILGMLGLYLAAMCLLSLAFFGLLLLFQ
jgi:hypothetical protein